MSLYKTYKNKKVLITGHTGFKGRWLSLFLFKLNANLLGVSSERNQLSKIIFNLLFKGLETPSFTNSGSVVAFNSISCL